MKEAANYQVGALLYCPANNKSLPNSIITERFGDKYSMALCLEDTINDSKVREAEIDMIESLTEIYKHLEAGEQFYIPKMFIRVRQAEQIERLIRELGPVANIVTGFNLPKFNMDNVDGYLEALSATKAIKHDLKFMPILESRDLADIRARAEFLYAIKGKIDSVEEDVTNVRVGGNDLCHIYGLRRHLTETIYDIKPVASALTDILSVFLQDYVVSGPVFEYYNGSDWDASLARECQKDVAAGFIGKTAIHPKQVDIINNALRVFKEDYEDAIQIMNWDPSSTYVKGNSTGSRMNEVKTHLNWAKRTIALAEYYGTK